MDRVKVASDGRLFADDRTRFWAKVDVKGPNECWLWQGGRAGGRKRSYGAFRTKQPRAIVYTHRYAYCLANGMDVHDLPREAVVKHSCDTHLCCNPSHLSLGTQAENVIEARDRGLLRKGSQIHNAILKESDIPAIREAIRGGVTRKTLARQYGVSTGAITGIWLGKSWRHVR